MRSTYACGQTVATALMVFGIGLAVVPVASADPGDADQPQPPAPGAEVFQETASAPGPGVPPGPADAPKGVEPQSNVLSTGDPTKDACDLFNKAVGYAAINYEDFADFSAGSGNSVNYLDPTVGNANVAGRTALRQSAAAALSASTIPGVPPEISAPMQSWSLNAAKLVLVMGVRGGGDALNSTATQLNTDAKTAQMACAAAATRA